MGSVNDVIACSECFTDQGLKLDAKQIGFEDIRVCPNCSNDKGRKLSISELSELAHRFFVWGSFLRCKYGAVPLIQFNEHQKTSIEFSPWLKTDVEIFERLLGIGFFDYGPRLWMIGEVEPLKALHTTNKRLSIVERIIGEYPKRVITPHESFYRIRKNPKIPSNPLEYDSPPSDIAGDGRLDTKKNPVLYASQDLQVCVHECRVTAEDELYVATLKPKRPLKLLDLSILLREDNITEFESLDMAVHMLFFAAKHSYKITRSIAIRVQANGFDGVVFPSYFSLLRIGVMPFQTLYGLSLRSIPEFQEYEQNKAIPNLAIFGRPIERGDITIECINKLILNRVSYDIHFGPIR
jgi:RES domain